MIFGPLPSPARRCAAGVAALAAALLMVPPFPASASPSALSKASASAHSKASASAHSKADVPCPKPKVKAPAGIPARPKTPADDSVLRAVGGDALATKGLTVPPGAPAAPAITAATWVVADMDTGEVLGGCDPHGYQTPASVQKLLLAATVMPKLDPTKTVKVINQDVAIEPGSSAVGLVEGGQYPIETVWLGLLLNSGNDAANTLARLGGGKGGVPAAVAAMNDTAKRLGAYQTHAVTPSGLDGAGQFTSAYDLALIARACYNIKDFRRYEVTKMAKMPAQKKTATAPKTSGFQFQNENNLIFEYPGALGGKSGFTDLARHSYVGAAQRKGRRLVATLLGAENNPIRGWQQAVKLLDWGFALPKDASVGKLVEPDGKDAAGTASGSAASASPADTTAAAPTKAENAPRRLVPLAAAAAVAVTLAGTPLLLLLIQRRKQRMRRRRVRAQRYAR